jgi:hypothetical protein
MKTEICANCGHVIGFLETAHVFKGNVVCCKCNQVLQAEISANETPNLTPPPVYFLKENKPIKPPMSYTDRAVRAIIILFLISIITPEFLFAQTQTEKLKQRAIERRAKKEGKDPNDLLVNQPFLGIYLGETKNDILKRFDANDIISTKGDVLRFKDQKDSVFSFLNAHLFQDKVYQIECKITGGEDLLKSLQKKYGQPLYEEAKRGVSEQVKTWTVQFDFNTVRIELRGDTTRPRRNGCSLLYTHLQLEQQLNDATEKARKKEIKDNL